MPNEMTPQEIAENLDSMNEELFDGTGYTLKLAATLCRRVASGELAEVIHAHWKEVEPGHDILFQCSNCGRIVSTSWGSCEDEDTHGNNGCDPTEEWLSCPTCGALIGGKDDEDAEVH